MSYRLSEAPGDFPGDAHTRLYTVSPVAGRCWRTVMRGALTALAVLFNALYYRPPGCPGDMAAPPGTPTQFVASAPASSGFRLDEISSSNSARGKTGTISTSPICSPMVTMDGGVTWNISGTIPDLRLVETTAFIPPLDARLAVLAILSHLVLILATITFRMRTCGRTLPSTAFPMGHIYIMANARLIRIFGPPKSPIVVQYTGPPCAYSKRWHCS